jgi:hypothetical protein
MRKTVTVKKYWLVYNFAPKSLVNFIKGQTLHYSKVDRIGSNIQCVEFPTRDNEENM